MYWASDVYFLSYTYCTSLWAFGGATWCYKIHLLRLHIATPTLVKSRRLSPIPLNCNLKGWKYSQIKRTGNAGDYGRSGVRYDWPLIVSELIIFSPLKNHKYIAAHIVISRVGHTFFSKECNVLAFFYVLYKRMPHSLRSFTFFIKEHCVLCVLLRYSNNQSH